MIREVEWGYNRDKERLPQINMGMYYGEESCLPLYYRVYPGEHIGQDALEIYGCGQRVYQWEMHRFVMDRDFTARRICNS